MIFEMGLKLIDIISTNQYELDEILIIYNQYKNRKYQSSIDQLTINSHL